MSSSVWSTRLGSARGTALRIHFSLFLLVVWVSVEQADPLLHGSLLAGALLTAVLCQLAGIAVGARCLRAGLSEVVLYPFGAAYALSKPLDPRREAILAACLPLTNVAAGLCLWLMTGSGNGPLIRWLHAAGLVNLFLALINIVPAFPFAGGRILQNVLLLLRFKNVGTTVYRLSPPLVAAALALGLMRGTFLELFVTATALVLAVQGLLRANAQSVLSELRVKDLLIPGSDLQSFSHATSISQALRTVLHSTQDSFPVLHNGAVLGIIDKETLFQRAADSDGEAYVAEFMRRDFEALEAGETVDRALEIMESTNLRMLPVTTDGAFAGVVFKEKVFELLLLHSLGNQRAGDRPGPEKLP